jgi:Putative peptidoglycan binding domain
MKSRLLNLATMTLLGAMGGLTSTAEAVEQATIWNNSTHTVTYYCRQSNLGWSPPQVLDPGGHRSYAIAPGTQLIITFNSTPTNLPGSLSPPRPVATAAVANLADRGAFSCFRDMTPFDVGLSVMDLRTTQGLQLALLTLGHDPGPIDGFYGPQTISAVMAFQTDNNLLVDGNAGVLTRTALRGALNAKP